MRPALLVLVVLLILTGGAVILTASGVLDSLGSPSPTGSGDLAASAGPTASPDYSYPSAEDIGACFDPIQDSDDGSLLALRVLECTEPHQSEFMGIGRMAAPEGAPWPGDAAVNSETEEICLEIFKDYIGIAYEDSRIDLSIVGPHQASWDAGDREVWCMADSPFVPLRQSVKDLGT